MPDLEPITREEMLLDGEDLTPITRKEKFIKRIYDKTQEIPEPITREEMFLKKAGEGGGGDVTIEQLDVSANGTYSESGKAYSPVVVNVPTPTPPENAYLLEEYEDVPTDIASFTASDAPLKSLTASIVPVQSGSGDPSPTNVRPISGWTKEYIVNHANSNLIGFDDEEITSADGGLTLKAIEGRVHINGIANANTFLSTKVIMRFKAGNYTIAYRPSNTRIFLVNADTGVRYGDEQSNHIYVTLDKDVNVRLSVRADKDKQFNDVVLEPRVVEGHTRDSVFERFNGYTTTIPFTDGQGNPVEVYGGSVDVTGGESTIVGKKFLLAPTDSQIFNVTNRNCVFSAPETANGFTLAVTNLLCNKLKPSNYSTAEDNHIHFANATLLTIYTSEDVGTTKKDWIQWFDDMQVEIYYKLATPTTFYTQPTSIKSLDGENNVSASTGQIEALEFFTKEA